MTELKRVRMALALFLSAMFLLLIPTLAGAQSLAGSVRDSSGAVLPGVAVEASSPALIEKTRSTVTDDRGQYQIVDLRPGTYAVTFTLSGFSTIARTGVEVSGGGVTAINAEMRVGGVQETITVTGATPVVDLQTSTSREQVLSNEFVRSLPASRGYGNYLAGVPGIQGTGLGASATPSNNFFTSRGGRSSEGNIQIDGMNVGSSVGGGGVSGYQYDMSNASEVQVTIAGGLAEVDRGGPAFNMVPKTGGNTFGGAYFGSIAGKWAQGSNIDDELRSFGFTGENVLIRNWDTNFAFSGPILRDRIWFYSNVRTIGTYQDVPNNYGNKNAFDPGLWTYAKDDSLKVRNATSKKIGATRLTWQATQRNKLGFYVDYTKNCSGSSVTTDGGQCRQPGDGWTASGPGIGPGVPTTSPESGTIWDAPAKIMQATYSAPLSTRVLFEAGYSSFWTQWGDIRPTGAAVDQIAVTEQSTTAGTPTSNFIYHGWPATSGTQQQNANYRAALSYVTGTHTLKVGYQGAYMVAKTPGFVAQQLSYRFNGGVPNQLTERLGPTLTSNRTVPDSLFVQDQWTRGRVTLQGGLRYEHVRSFFPEGENGVVADHRFGPAFTFPRTEGVKGYNDLTPRMGASYDVFGDGKTAVKVSMSKYLQAPYNGDVYTINNPAVTLVQTTSRVWTDANNNRIAECDFLNPGVSGECQAWTNLNWGQQGQTTQVNPDVQQGWGKRNWDWQFSAGVQHELLPRVSVDASYSRRKWGNFFVTQNRALTPQDYDEVTITTPNDPRLPGGGGYPVSFLVRNNRSVLGVSDPYYTTSADYGEETHYWHGVDVTLNARLHNGLLFQGGTSTGRGVNDTCAVLVGRFGRPMTPSTTTVAATGIVAGQPACSATEPWLTSARGLVSYTVPKIDVLVSAILRTQANVQPGADVATNGASRSANYLMSATQFLAATGRPLRTGVTTETVNLLLPGQIYGERVNNIDMRVAKIVRIKATKANVGVDLYNLTNANTPTTFESTYDPGTGGERWMRPTALLQPRFVRFNVQFDF
ncbi:MAG: carboxypeptidase regulatory-like domain-containing protein [Acidobacteriota bacterium]